MVYLQAVKFSLNTTLGVPQTKKATFVFFLFFTSLSVFTPKVQVTPNYPNTLGISHFENKPAIIPTFRPLIRLLCSIDLINHLKVAICSEQRFNNFRAHGN